MRLLILTFVLLLCVQSVVLAIPQFSLLSGNRCSNCHVAPAGGGLRSELGWYSYQDVSIVPRTAPAVKWLYDLDESNLYADGKLTFGVDLRVQSTRSFASDSTQRKTFPMQATLYGAYTPIKSFTVEGSFNLASVRSNAPMFAGQRLGHVSAMFKPDSTGMVLRAGFFRPSINVRYDDHTNATYGYISTNSVVRNTLIAPDWAEYGAEVTYEEHKWLTLQAGVFGSEGLQQVRLPNGSAGLSSAVTGNSPTITARAVVWPRAMDDMLNFYAGTSMLSNGDFLLASGFAGAGITDNLSLMLDYTSTSKPGVLKSSTAMAELSWQVTSPVIAYARYETYSTKYAGLNSTIDANAAVLGAQVFVLPYVVLRPEYRIWDTNLEGVIARWNAQLHIFY